MDGGLGLCNLDGGQTVCRGDLNYCEKPGALNQSLKHHDGNGKNRRKHPRVILDLPLEYRVTDIPHAHGGSVVNGSETGLLIESVKDLPIGMVLKIAVIFPKKYEISNLQVWGQIVWKETHWKEDWEGYQYGLKLIQIRKEDHWFLRQLLCGRYNLDET
jgi:hypothetical protein